MSRTPERDQLGYVLDVIHDSLPPGRTKLASIITQFLARAVTLMLTPGMYTWVLDVIHDSYDDSRLCLVFYHCY